MFRKIFSAALTGLLLLAIAASGQGAGAGVEKLHRKSMRDEKSLQGAPWTMAEEAEGIFKLAQEGATLSVEFSGDLEIDGLTIDGVAVEPGEDGRWVIERSKPKKNPKVTAVLADSKIALDLDQPVIRDEVAVLVVAGKGGKLKASPSFWASKLPQQ